jgi:Protein of unknown function (DUF2384)
MSSELAALAHAIVRLRSEIRALGRSATERLRSTDPDLAEGLEAVFDSPDQPAAWLVERTIGFRGRTALELLANGERDTVLRALHHIQYGLGA